MWPQIAREQLGAGNAGFATSWELPGSWEPARVVEYRYSECHNMDKFTRPAPRAAARCMPPVSGQEQVCNSRLEL
jgi:hypothetical protein